MQDKIVIKGAREHNLKNIDLVVPRDKLVVFTGLSGSGKSSLAFDTIFAEGQRRYVESLSAYARQFLGQVEKPDVDYIEGLSPAVSIDQKTTSKNPRSTVGTVTEIYDYLRLLFARVGVPHCPKCGKEIKKQSPTQIVDTLMAEGEKAKLQILAPIVRGQKGTHQKELESAKRSGYVRVRVDKNMYDLGEEITLEKNKKHSIEVVVDRIVVKEDSRKRLTDSVETALALGKGMVIVDVNGEEMTFSENYACDDCGISMPELQPRMFSFNSPFGACPNCDGLGDKLTINEDLLIPDKSRSLNDGAVRVFGWTLSDTTTIAYMYFSALASEYNFSLDTPYKDLPANVKKVIMYGTNGRKLKMPYSRESGTGEYISEFEGLVNNMERRYKETNSDYARAEIESYMTSVPCQECGGKRLKKEILAITVGDKNISDVSTLSIEKALEFFENLTLNPRDEKIARQVVKEIKGRLKFLQKVGLSYLSLSRASGSLSGGESQRIRLATQIGSSLMGVLYILDEPSIGLHQRDNDKLLETLEHLRDIGNTLIVVEHDEDTIRRADHVVDIGPGAGVNGGYVVAQGSVADIMACKDSITGDYLSGRKAIEIPKERRAGNGKTLVAKGCTENNLKNVDVSIPLNTFTCVTGVSGSGKSSLINHIINKRLTSELNGARANWGSHKEMIGIEHLDKVINIDQSPIGRTPRSNPATYTGLFTNIRDLFASTVEAKARGYKSGRFSFNVKGGRCHACDGDGILKIEMHFLSDVYVTCEVCGGKRYNNETLEVTYKGKNISEVLDMTVDEGVKFFENMPSILRKMETLSYVGLGYIKIGQSSTTLSGGEAQRVKLATELSKRSTGKTIYILDEPTTGLHVADVHKLITVLQKLVEAGNTVLVIEHNLDIIKTADYIIDLGPEGGDKGGFIVAEGTPEEVAKSPKSYTGQYLKKVLNAESTPK